MTVFRVTQRQVITYIWTVDSEDCDTAEALEDALDASDGVPDGADQGFTSETEARCTFCGAFVTAVDEDSVAQHEDHTLARGVPQDYPVKVIPNDDPTPGRTTCGTCNRSWDDGISTEMTPAPSGRCPFEYYH